MVNECGYIVFLLLLVPYIESGKHKTFDNSGVRAVRGFILPYRLFDGNQLRHVNEIKGLLSRLGSNNTTISKSLCG
jgi:hypothetical protein